MKNISSWDEFKMNESHDLVLEKLEVKKLINKLKSKVSKKTTKMILIALLGIYSMTQVIDLLKSENIPEETYSEIITELDTIPMSTDTKQIPVTINGASNVNDLKLSQETWDFIREEEGLRLTAYKIKTKKGKSDGMITIGYGHAERASKSQYKVGDKITIEKANELLRQDVNYAADGVRRIFADWEKEGINRYITQGQYDALVSMAYNMGVGGLRRTDVIKYLKEGDIEKAAEKIKTARVSSKFPGLIKRRLKEYKLFNKDTVTKSTKDTTFSSAIPNWKQDVNW